MIFPSFFSFNCEHESKQPNSIVSCYWDPDNSARIIYLFIYLFRFYFSYSNSKKWNYIGHLHGEAIFQNIFNCKYILSPFTFFLIVSIF